MYDVSGTDTDREWVEVFNAGSSSVHFTDWKFFEANTNHGVTSVQGGENLPSGGYAVIADNPTKFLLDWPSYTGILFDSTFSLGNSGETLAVHMPPPELTETDSISYQSAWGAGGNGNSLQRTSTSGSTFTESAPTPGTGSLSSSGGGDSGSSSGSDTGATTTTAQSTTSGNTAGGSFVMPPPPRVVADGGSDRTAIVGADVEFKARAYDEKKNLIDFSHFHWNFGDGSTAELAVVFHRFDYPGRYVVILELPDETDSVPDQITVTVEPMKLALSLLPDGGVAIENRAGRNVDLSRWVIRSFGKTFTIPEHTLLLANTTWRVSQRTLGFSSGSELELDYPSGSTALRLTLEEPPAAVPAPAQTSDEVNTSPQNTQENIPASEKTSEPVADVAQEQFPESTSSAEVAAAVQTQSGAPSSRLWWFRALAIAGLAAGSLAIARRYGKKEWDIEEVG